jgi:hypothetical protein
MIGLQAVNGVLRVIINNNIIVITVKFNLNNIINIFYEI